MTVDEQIEDIDERRRKIGVSISQLCRQADLNESTYGRILRGKTTKVHKLTFRKLEDALFAMIAKKQESASTGQARGQAAQDFDHTNKEAAE